MAKKSAKQTVVAAVCIAVACVIIAVLMHIFPVKFVETGSMAPTIPPGSVVVDMPVNAVHIGDVISVVEGGSVVTHRVVGIQPNGGIITKGDANQDTDVPGVRPTIKNVIGKVVFSAPLWTIALVAGGALLLIIAVMAFWSLRKEPDKQPLAAIPA